MGFWCTKKDGPVMNAVNGWSLVSRRNISMRSDWINQIPHPHAGKSRERVAMQVACGLRIHTSTHMSSIHAPWVSKLIRDHRVRDQTRTALHCILLLLEA